MSVQRKYRKMLQSIQSKFKVISKAYSQVVSQLQKKKQIIKDLNTVIQVLQQKLEQSDSKIHDLQMKLGKEITIKKMIITSHRKHQSSAETIFTRPNQKKIVETNNRSLTDLNSNGPIVNAFQFKNQSKQLIQKDWNSSVDYNKTVFLNQRGLKNEIHQQNEDNVQTKIEIPMNIIKKKNAQLKQNDKNIFNSTKRSQKSNCSQKLPSVSQQPKQNKGQILNKSNMSQLTKIWQQRDRQIMKMEELFENINNRIRQYDQ